MQHWAQCTRFTYYNLESGQKLSCLFSHNICGNAQLNIISTPNIRQCPFSLNRIFFFLLRNSERASDRERDRQTYRKGKANVLQGKQLNTTQHNRWHFQKQGIRHTFSNDILKKCVIVTQIYSEEDKPCHPANAVNTINKVYIDSVSILLNKHKIFLKDFKTYQPFCNSILLRSDSGTPINLLLTKTSRDCCTTASITISTLQSFPRENKSYSAF